MPHQIRALVAGFAILVVSVVLGSVVAAGNYEYLVLLVFLPVLIAAIIVRGYEFFLAFGLLCPFAFPIPFIYEFPFVGLILGFCCFKFAFSRGMEKTPISYHWSFNLLTLILFSWVLIRYCMNPVMPGLAVGRGSSISGFRAYLNYGICFALAVTTGFFVRNRQEVIRLIKWMGIISVFFAALFIPLTFTKSLAVATILTQFGLPVTFFDNGWLRFVPLPNFGLLILITALLPGLFPMRRSWRVALGIAGVLAIIMGGNRSTVGMAFIAVLAITVVRGGMRVFLGTSAAIALCLLVFYYIGETARFEKGIGFFRILALVSERVARQTDAAANYEWRQVRWELAMIDVQRHPWIGVGYGGLAGVFAVTTFEEFAHNSAEIDVAAGTLHNGFIAGARAFGIPFCLLFIVLLGSRIFAHWRQALKERGRDPTQSDLHSFVFANLAALPIGIYIGADLNLPHIWLYLALGFIISKLKQHKTMAAAPSGTEASVGAAFTEPIPNASAS